MGERETKGLDELLEAAYNSSEKKLTGWKTSQMEEPLQHKSSTGYLFQLVSPLPENYFKGIKYIHTYNSPRICLTIYLTLPHQEETVQVAL